MTERRNATRPVFAGDDWQELRDAMADAAADTMSRVVGRVAYLIHRSAIALGAENLPLARELRSEELFDLRTLYVAHGHIAAYWRLQNNHLLPAIPGTTHLDRMIDDFQKWALQETVHWFHDNPRLIHLLAVVAVGWQRRDTVLNEISLYEELTAFLPLPPPDTPDLFDEPAGSHPYR